MPKLSKDKILPECQGCKTPFTEIKRHARNLCSKCYHIEHNTKKKGATIKILDCQVCGLKVGDINSKGKKVTRVTKGYCNNHYQRWYLTNSCKNCKTCGVEFRNVKLGCYCDLCKPDKKKEKKSSKKMKKGTLLKRNEISVENLSLMLTLFRRFKNGSQTAVDHFRVAHLYLDIFDGQPFVYNSMLDSYNEESQVVLMLRQLKSVYDNV